jgi:hypothetical protein
MNSQQLKADQGLAVGEQEGWKEGIREDTKKVLEGWLCCSDGFKDVNICQTLNHTH